MQKIWLFVGLLDGTEVECLIEKKLKTSMCNLKMMLKAAVEVICSPPHRRQFVFSLFLIGEHIICFFRPSET